MDRRHFLVTLPSLAAARMLIAADGQGPSRIGLCTFSCHQQWKAVGNAGVEVNFHDAATFYRYARELGAEGVQTSLRSTDPAIAKAIRTLVEESDGKRGQGPNFVFHVPFHRCFFFHSRIFFGSSDSGFTANFLTCTDTLSALRIDKRAAIQDSFKDVFREIAHATATRIMLPRDKAAKSSLPPPSILKYSTASLITSSASRSAWSFA